MMTTDESVILPVLPLGMDTRKLAVLRMAFRMHKAIRYQLAESAAAVPALAIVDVDSPQGWAVWDTLRADHPQLPALIVSAFAQNAAPAPVLAKPIRVETLFPALQQLLAGPPLQEQAVAPALLARKEEAPAVVAADHATADAARQAVEPMPRAPAPVVADAAPGAEPAPAPVPPAPSPSAKVVAPWPDQLDSFDPNAGLYGVLRALYRQRRSAAVVVEGQVVLRFYPAQEKCELDADQATLMRLCAAPRLSVRLAALRDGKENPGIDAQTAHAVLWRIALWSARGRMPEGIGPNSQLRLRHWPNLTRLAVIPDAMRMAAFWTRTPASARTAQRMLGVEVTDLCNFIAACLAIDLLDTRLAPVASNPIPAPRPLADDASRGLLSRLLARLRGA